MVFGEPFLPLYTVSRNILKQEMLLVAVFIALAVIIVAVVLFVKRKVLGAIYKNETFRLILFSVLFSFVALIPFLGLGILPKDTKGWRLLALRF